MQKSTKILSTCQIPVSLSGLIIFVVGLIIINVDRLTKNNGDDLGDTLLFIAGLILAVSMLLAIANGIVGRKENFSQKLSGKTYMILMIVFAVIGIVGSVLFTIRIYQDLNSYEWINVIDETVGVLGFFIAAAISLFHTAMSIAVLVLGKKNKTKKH